MTPASHAIGTHILADFFGVDAGLLRDGPRLDAVLRRAAQGAGAHPLSSHFHSFGDRDGVTGVVLLAESHLSIHTWPEFEFAALDIFMCGSAEPRRALEALSTALTPTRTTVKTEQRGVGPSMRAVEDDALHRPDQPDRGNGQRCGDRNAWSEPRFVAKPSDQ
jgi:S-adenosylmethionine decarboxylase